jgi:hypothetical protein
MPKKIWILCALLILILISIACSMPAAAVMPKDNCTSVPLVALNLGSEIKGTFFLTSGYIGNQEMVRYLYQDSNGAIRFGKIHAEYVYIYEGDFAPHLEYCFVGSFDENYSPHKFYVPPNTVLREFNFSLNDSKQNGG